MKKFVANNKINLLFLLISLICLISVLGIDNISFKSVDWLYSGSEATLNQLGWYFFKNDIWRFPFGSNPNYGFGFGNSIVFTDSIPLLALFFKLLNPIISENFQYFSFWYLICFFLQLFYSFKILKKFTNNDLYSFIGSIFFLVAPIFVYRLDWHAAVSGQWILLFSLYLALTKDLKKTKFQWFLIIILSSLVNYSFTAMTLIMYFLLRLYNLYFSRKNFLFLIKDFSLIFILLFFTIYLAGYFEVRMADTLGLGFGYYKLNLLSIVDPINSVDKISWSWFLPDIRSSDGEELEGFNYFGLGQIIMIMFAIIIFFNKKNNNIFVGLKNNKQIKAFILVSIFFTFWAFSTKISFGSITLIDIPLNKYIFAALSVIKNTGRMFWVVNYFLLILALLVVYQYFKGKRSSYIILIFLLIQIGDTSAGIKNRIHFFQPKNQIIDLKDPIWEKLFKKYDTVKTTYPVSWSGLFTRFSYLMEKYKIKKTNLVILARINRKEVAEARYKLYKQFRNKKLESNTVYLIDNLTHLRHLQYLFKDENVGFFKRDNVWSMILNEKVNMNINDQKEFNKIQPKILEISKSEDLNFRNKDSFFGLGWSHNLSDDGIWSEGPSSSLLFATEKDYKSIKIEILCEPYITKKNTNINFDIYVNNLFYKNMEYKFKENTLKNEKIEIILDKNFIKNNEILVDFNFINPVSPLEILDSPDSRKLGILLKNIKITQI